MSMDSHPQPAVTVLILESDRIFSFPLLILEMGDIRLGLRSLWSVNQYKGKEKSLPKSNGGMVPGLMNGFLTIFQ